MLSHSSIPGLFITGTDTGVGKTVIASAIANWFTRRGKRVGVCKIAATGGVMRGGELISEDALSLSAASGERFPLETICPICYAEPLAPAVAAARAGIPLDWSLLQRSLNTLVSQSDLLIVEGVGGVMVPMDDRHTVLDVMRWLGLPAVVVARAGLGTINHTLLTVATLRGAGVSVAGVVVNRFPVGQASAAEATNPGAIEEYGKVPVLCIVPECSTTGVIGAIEAVDWSGPAHGGMPVPTSCIARA